MVNTNAAGKLNKKKHQEGKKEFKGTVSHNIWDMISLQKKLWAWIPF